MAKFTCTALATVTIGALLLASTTFGGDPSGLNVTWSLPASLLMLPIGRGGSPVPLLAQDNETIYTANSTGAVMAIRAADGAVLWTYPANATQLTGILTAAEHPDYVYLVQTHVSSTQQHLFALRKADGKLTGSVDNLFGCLNCESTEQFKLVTNKYGLVLHHLDGLLAMDPSLTHVLWDRRHGKSTWLPFYRHIAANDELVATVQNLDMYEAADSFLVSYHAETGEVMCNISNATDSLTPLPFYVSNDNSIVAEHCKWFFYPVTYEEFIQVFDMKTCKHRHTAVFNDWSFESTDYQQFLWPPADAVMLKGSMQRDNYLFVVGNVTNVTNPSTGNLEGQYWTVKASPVSLRRSDHWQWVTDLPNPSNVSLQGAAIGAAHLQHHPDVVVFWANDVLTAVNGTSGAMLWNFTNQGKGIQVGLEDPNANSIYLVFPLSGDRLLVPNVLGYSIASLKDDRVVSSVSMEPLPVVLSFLRTTDGAAKEPFVVFYNEGALVSGPAWEPVERDGCSLETVELDVLHVYLIGGGVLLPFLI